MTLTQRIEEKIEICEKAHREICDLASGKRKFSMSVPPQDYDSDMTLQSVVDVAEQTLRCLKLAVEALDDLLSEISEPIWSDERMRYEERQITKGSVEKARQTLAQIEKELGK